MCGENFRTLAEKHPPHADPASAIAGKVYGILRPSWNTKYPYDELKTLYEKYDTLCGIEYAAKFTPDYTIGMGLGWQGLLDKIRYYASVNSSDDETRAFYEAEENVILGIQAWIRNTTDEIGRKLAIEQDPKYRENLEEMLEVHEWIVDNPPRTFREACQHVAWINMLIRSYTGSGMGCQLDEVLYPYYKRDIEEGRIDDEDATFYVACLLIADARHYTICGPDVYGNDITNPLSYVILEALHRADVAGNMNIRFHSKLDPEFFLKSVQYVLEDRTGVIRYSNDDALIEGFMRNGYPIELARMRRTTVCNWTTIHGREFSMHDLIKINMAKVFEVAYREMMDDRTSPKSLEVLWDLFEKHLREVILSVAQGLDFKFHHHKYSVPELALNPLCYGPIEQGLDASNGGVEFYNYCVSGAGLATVADSFAAIDQRVVREGALTWEALYEHIRNDFAGVEGEKARCLLQTSERFGQDTNSIGDQWARKVSRSYASLIKERSTPEGRNMLPQLYSWRQAVEMGKAVGATPNGRRAGERISTGPNPHDGFRADGAATALSNAVASVQTGYGNIDVMNLDLDPGIVDSLTVDKVAALIKTHFELGGTAIMINIVDAETLREAHKDPEAYPNLIVRVAGFTAHFAVLSPEVRQMVVDRVLAQG